MAEDLTTYTEVDPNSHLSATSARVTGSGVLRNESCYLYYDKGADYFDALDIDFVVMPTFVDAGDAIGLLGVSNTIGDFYSFGQYEHFILFYYTSGIKLYLNRGALAGSDNMAVSGIVAYYCTLERAAGADNVYLKVYSDAARTTLLDTLVISGMSGKKWRYIYAMSSYNSGASYASSAYCENIIINPTNASSLILQNHSRRFNPLLVR